MSATSRDGAPTILFYVQHLLGIGHVFRAIRVARGLAAAGCRVHIAWGGARLPAVDVSGLEVHYLEPVRVSDEHFQTLVRTSDGSELGEAGLNARRDHLLAIFAQTRPDILITEAYPFGRRHMRFELIPLMEAAHARADRPMVVTSIRDIMQENRSDKRVRETLDAVTRWFDLVLVHGDPGLIRIEETVEGAHEFLDKVRYTGLVTPEPVDRSLEPSIRPDVLVSSGGGALGIALMHAAVDAMVLSAKMPTNWCLTTGPDLPQVHYDAITARRPEGMTITRFVDDISVVMANAKVSVSRAGYNTVGDLLRARTRAVLLPFTGGRETEQLRRAQIMSERGVVSMLLDDDLTPQSLAAAIDRAVTLPRAPIDIDLAGASKTAPILIEEFERFGRG